MKLLHKVCLVLFFFVLRLAWSGTTTIVLQNSDYEGGYAGCFDTKIEKDYEHPVGDDVDLIPFYELCET